MKTCRLYVDDKEYVLEQGITLEDVSRMVPRANAEPYILAVVDGKLKELTAIVEDGSKIKFVSAGSSNGYMAFRRSACLVLLKAFQDVLGKDYGEVIEIKHVLGGSVYCECASGHIFSADILKAVENRMEELIGLDLKIVKKHVALDEIDEVFAPLRAEELKKMLRFRVHSHMNVYFLDDYADYFYGYMAPSTGYVAFDGLEGYGEGFLLHLPTRQYLKNRGKSSAEFDVAAENVKSMTPETAAEAGAKTAEKRSTTMNCPKLFCALEESKDWAKTMKVATVGDLNSRIAEGRMNELILVQEALMEKKLGAIADEIVSSGKKVVLVAGPSSSGKTSFSHRLSIQLMAHGLEPHPIAMDDYFVNREDNPIDPETGKYDFEALGAVDVELLNQDVLTLLAGGEIDMPTFNFITGLREYKGKKLKLGQKGILVIEGIHGLNEASTYRIPKEDKYKIYISALTALNVDSHNRIAASDGRLLRRMVRDVVGRGAAPEKTISMWSSVRAGEEKNIFPYQEEADVMFNSSLIYEISILKQYAMPLLFQVNPNTPEGIQAKRLLKFLSYFVGTDSTRVPNNSILREFIGGSCFF